MPNSDYKIFLASDVDEDSMSAEIELDGKYFMRIIELNDHNNKLYVEFDGFEKNRMELEVFKKMFLEAEKRILR